MSDIVQFESPYNYYKKCQSNTYDKSKIRPNDNRSKRSSFSNIDTAQYVAMRNVSDAIVNIADKQQTIVENCETPIDEFSIFNEWWFKNKTKDGVENTDAGKTVLAEKAKKIAIDAYLEHNKLHEKPVVRMSLKGVDTVNQLDSFIGGSPGFLPKGFKIPKAKKGDFVFLAQINCSELTTLPDFPHTGILSLWVSNDWSELEGRVFWFDKPTNGMSADEISSIYSNDIAKDELADGLDSYHKITCNPGVEAPDLYDEYQWDYDGFVDIYNRLAKDNGIDPIEKLTGHQWFGSLPADISDIIHKYSGEMNINAYGTKCGGYPFFTQSTPYELKTFTELLFQQDSEDGIQWGDDGVANFHMKKEDLKTHDFHNVFFTWDCC